MRIKGLFYGVSKSVAHELAGIFDYTWPTVVAFKELRQRLHPEDRKGVADLIRSVGEVRCNAANFGSLLSSTEEEVEAQIAKRLLYDQCALLEGWLEELVSLVAPPGKKDGWKRERLKDLQFPGSVRVAVKNLAQPESGFVKNNLHDQLTGHKHYLGGTEVIHTLPGGAAADRLQSLLWCYRAFKELRNAFIHNGGRSSSKFHDAATNWQQLRMAIKPHDLAMKRLPKVPVVAVGDPLTIDLYEVVGFGGIVTRLLRTLDADLAVAKSAEKEISRRWTLAYGAGVALGRSRSAVGMLRVIGFPAAKHAGDLVVFLKAEGLGT